MAEAARETFIGLTPEGWIAIGTIGLFLATATLAGVKYGRKPERTGRSRL